MENTEELKIEIEKLKQQVKQLNDKLSYQKIIHKEHVNHLVSQILELKGKA